LPETPETPLTTETVGTGLEIRDILQAMPHRYPFVLLDRVLERTPGRCLAVKNVTVGECHFTGHFPGLPIMPGCLIIEALAQAGSFMGGRPGEAAPAGKIEEAFLLASEAKFLKPVVPGDRLLITASLLSDSRGIVRFKSDGHVNNELVASGRFTVLLRRGSPVAATAETEETKETRESAEG